MVVAAVTKYNEKDYSGAEAVLKQAVAEDPENDAAWYYLALCASARQDMASAEEYLVMAHELDPSNFWYRHIFEDRSRGADSQHV